MNYQETLDYLFSKLPMYQRNGAAAYKEDIGNITIASKHLGNPHRKFKSIHIAGTNGKGSVAHMIVSVMQESGYKVGLYTSPHLKDFRERIKINGEMISEENVINFVKENKFIFDKIDLSFFEFTVAMAFDYFANEEVNIAIIETGLGGRLDSTNIINPELSIITNIGLDHTNLLGDSLEEISLEKAGIIKNNVPVIIGRKQKETTNIFREAAKKKNATLIYSEEQKEYKTDLLGAYQKENINTAVTAINELQKQNWKITEENIKSGLLKIVKNTSLFGRWQILNKTPLIICDTGHNADGIKEIVKQLNKLEYKKLHFLYGTVNDKNTEKILSMLPTDAEYYFCKANIPRGLDESVLRDLAYKEGLKGKSYSSVSKALKLAKNNATKDDLIFIGGSTFIVAEVI
jgi:dihydrofolate synthase / folylpolyglutamate synthase